MTKLHVRRGQAPAPHRLPHLSLPLPPLPSLLLFVVAALALSACASTPSSNVAPDSPLVGMWRGPVPMGAPDGSCTFDLEIFADGSAEVNHVDDDSIAEACGYVRVLFVVEGDVLKLGNAATCRHRLDRDGDRDLLRIACEDHGTPPASLDNALTLRRLPVREVRGQAAVAGRWSSAPIFGKATELSLDGEGRGSMGTELVRFIARDDGTASLELESGTTTCIYRATPDRLTLRCSEPGGSTPRSFVEDGAKGTIVLVRAL